VRIPAAKILLWLSGLAVAGWLAAQVDPGRYEGGRARDEQERAQRNRSALAVMLGEFRTSASDVMFIKTERYMHGGVAFRQGQRTAAQGAEDLYATEEEEMAGHDGEEHGHSHGHGDDEHGAACASHGMPTVIPPAEKDFRGWVGDLYRAVKPWRDSSKPHIHTDGRELLPWFRLMTLSDPGYIQGYLAGGFWLQKQGSAMALDFIEEGLRKNPEAFQLHLSRGLLRLRQARDAEAGPVEESARVLFVEARDDCLRAAELGLSQRLAKVDEESGTVEDWSKYQENDLLAACRLAIILSERLGEVQTAARCRERFAALGPHLP